MGPQVHLHKLYQRLTLLGNHGVFFTGCRKADALASRLSERSYSEQAEIWPVEAEIWVEFFSSVFCRVLTFLSCPLFWCGPFTLFVLVAFLFLVVLTESRYVRIHKLSILGVGVVAFRLLVF